VRNLAVPFDWQEAVIRAAITLKLNTFDDTGAVIAAMTDFGAGGARHGAQLGLPVLLAARRLFRDQRAQRSVATGSMERYLRYIENIIVDADPATLQPVYGLSGESRLTSAWRSTWSGMRAWDPCASATRRGSRSSTTSTGPRSSVFRMRSSTTGSTPWATVTSAALEPLGEQAYAKFMQRSR